MPKTITFIFVFLFIRFGLAQNDKYKFSHISDTDGLSQNSVVAIHQDKLGQIWFGTRDGLNKYDGEEFTVYRHQKDNKSSISNNGVLCIEGDRNGFIWVGTSFGLNRYDPKKNAFKTYFLNEKARYLGNNMIKVIKELSKNEIWIVSSSGVSIYNDKTDTFNTILKKNNITSILETKSGILLIGTTKGLLRLLDKENGNYQFENIIGTESLFVQDMVETADGNILLGTQMMSVLKYDISKNSVQPYFEKFLLKDKNKNVRKLLFDDNGELWIATYNGIQISNNQKHLIALYNDDNDDKSINDNFIKTLFKDNTGVIWIGTYYGGINIWNDFNKNFINISQKSTKSGLSFKVVSSIVNYNNLLLFGTEGGGISVLNQDDHTIQHITTKNASALKSDNIKSLCVTNNDKLWVGTFTNSIAIFNLKTKVFEKLPFPKKLNDFLENVGVLSIVQYDDDNILIGTNYKGLVKYNTRQNLFKIYNTNSKPLGLTSNNVKTIKVDSKNNIWVGTIRGLNCISPNEEITNHVYKADLKVKFEINTIFEDNKGVLWIGTFEDGLFKFENNQFVPVSLKIDKVEINGIRSIEEAEKGKFWISTFTQGILKYNPLKDKIEAYYSKKEGLASNQFNRDASLRIGETQYYFGGSSGVTYFDESKLTKNKYSPQVIITDFKIQNASVEVDGEHQLLENTISYTKHLELEYNQGNFSLSYAIPNFINAGSNSYMYRLKGLETDWVKTSNNTATYTIQKPGSYTFEVKGINSDGVVNQKPTLLEIYVNPAPWASWWAYTLYFIAIGVVVYYLFNILKAKTKLKHQLELEHVRAQQIEKTNKSKLEFFTNISHEFRTPLTLILGPLQQILENYRGSSQMYRKLKVVESSSNQLLQLINRLMDFRKYENKLMKLEASEGNIVKFIEEICLSFSEYAKAKDYKYNFATSSDDIYLYYDSAKLERVFYNLISNAFKYTPDQGEINIEIIEDIDKIVVSVCDTGVGIPEEYVDKIFERFFEISDLKEGKNNNKGTGIGLSIVKSIIDLHKGKISVANSTKTSGSVFSVELLKGKGHLNDADIVKDFKFSDDISLYENQLKEQDLSFNDTAMFRNIPSIEKSSILVVEDNKQLRGFIRNLLEFSYNVYEAENGKEGFKIAIKEEIDLIVSDVVMPITSGIELCALVKGDIRTSHIPVILLTTRSSLIYKLDGLERGADDYISKPFNIKEFEFRISNVLKSISRLKQKMNTNEILNQDDIVMSSLDEKLYKKALDIIEKNIINSDFDIPYFCEELGVSKSVLFTKVKAWTDYTPKQFIQHIRLKRAARLLEQGKSEIGQISLIVGFKDPKYFSKIFKRKFGKTPKAYSESFLEY
ncbi:hybrid sensor histidine kinase/response regulator transcription factor [Algibacter luteus]|uniref:hybrid sensor histidine kinase/response regulator transcription factor n=1 Tax=Algibacter luteus TaxID=1178825 RepID=UPI002596383E|nr:two-component regulator propeller domain-containing protein [Algibacter luteus]WJJ97717.1 two-component regulator propeller domain-containing protein [Algibacter luteus]